MESHLAPQGQLRFSTSYILATLSRCILIVASSHAVRYLHSSCFMVAASCMLRGPLILSAICSRALSCCKLAARGPSQDVCQRLSAPTGCLLAAQGLSQTVCYLTEAAQWPDRLVYYSSGPSKAYSSCSVFRGPHRLYANCSVFRDPHRLYASCSVFRGPHRLYASCSVFRGPHRLHASCSVFKGPHRLYASCSVFSGPHRFMGPSQAIASCSGPGPSKAFAICGSTTFCCMWGSLHN
jgi:hypothetical protein